MKNLNYNWVARLDDDSYFLSPVRYNIFSFMRFNSLEYGFRIISREVPAYDSIFWDYLNTFMKNKKITNNLMFDTCNTKEIGTLSMHNCGSFLGFYNNFFVANVSFFNSKRVQDFLRDFDNNGFIFKYRWSDLLVQSLAVKLFSTQEKVHHFQDFTYAHNSKSPETINFGILQSGKGLSLYNLTDPSWKNVKPFMKNVHFGMETVAFPSVQVESGCSRNTDFILC